MRVNTGGEKNNSFSCKYFNCPGLLRLSEKTVLVIPENECYEVLLQEDKCTKGKTLYQYRSIDFHFF